MKEQKHKKNHKKSRIVHDRGEIAKDRNRIGMISGVIGILLNLILSTSKIVVGTIASSISMVADGVNNLADIASNLASMIGFHLAKKPADAEHPYGHARFEYISGLVISVLIFFAAGSLFWESLLGIFHGGTLVYSAVAIGVLAFSIAIKIGMGFLNLSLSKKINSKTLRAVAIDSFSDSVATFGVVIAMLLKLWLDIDIDGVIGVVVSVLIFLSGVNIQKEVLSSLLGEKITAEQAVEIGEVICGYNGVLGLHDLMMHSYGEGNVYASCHVEMDAKIPPLESHDIIDDIERHFAKGGIHMVVHYDPVELDNERTNLLKQMVVEGLKEAGHNLKLHDFRAVYSASHTNLVFDLVVPYNYCKTDSEILQALQAKLDECGEKFYLVVDFDRDF